MPNLRLDHYDMEIDPRLRDTPSAGSYTQQAHPPSAPSQIPIAPLPSRSPAAPQQYHPAQDGSPQNYYLPQTPQSGGNATDNDGANGAHDGDGGPTDPKRSRACEACRGLKVKCEPDPNNQDLPCKRCAKANRNCVVTQPSRKRQKKTDSRVAELEKKIDALTATLAQKSGPNVVGHNEGGVNTEVSTMATQAQQNPYQQVTNGGYGSAFAQAPEARAAEWGNYLGKAPVFESSRKSAPPMVVAGQKRKHIETFSTASNSPMSGGTRKSVDGSSAQQSTDYVPFLLAPGSKPAPTHEYTDVVDRGLVTADMAATMFDCYVEQMAPHMPAVVFDAGTTAAEVRKTKPTLFLAILAASSGSNFPDIQKKLTKEIMSIYAERIICNGEKTLELIQALQVSSLWYYPPEHFEELKFYQLIHIAAVMAIDIGLGKRNKHKGPGLWRDHPWRRTPYPDPTSIEARRAWLGCYFLCCNAAMGLRRPNLIRWTPFMEDCVNILETSPDAAPTDRALCNWVRVQYIAEQIGVAFEMDDPTAKVTIADSKVQYAIKGFENNLDKWSSQVPPEARSPMLKMSEYVVNLYMHEVALHVDHNVEEFKPPFTEDTLGGVGVGDGTSLSPDHIAALSVCLRSVDGIFETFLKLDVETVRCLPVINFVRIAYAVVVLIKMYFAAATPNSELGKVINKDHMKVEYYLDGLVAMFTASAADKKSRPSHKFLMVLLMLKTWFGKQREGKEPKSGESGALLDTPAEAPSEKHNSQQRSAQQAYGAENTPLQLLSEVATNPGGQSRSGSISQYPGSTNEWQQPQQQSYVNYPSMTQMSATSYGNSSMGNIDPSLGTDLSYTMGDNLEEAMGMTIGVGPYGEYYSDDMFYGFNNGLSAFEGM